MKYCSMCGKRKMSDTGNLCKPCSDKGKTQHANEMKLNQRKRIEILEAKVEALEKLIMGGEKHDSARTGNI